MRRIAVALIAVLALILFLLPGTSFQASAAPAAAAPDKTAPVVVATVPDRGATNFNLTGKIAVVFSEAMNPATINATTLTLSIEGVGIPGKVAYDAKTKTATFSPDKKLQGPARHQVTITTGAKDEAGNAMKIPYVGYFVTSCTPATKTAR